MSKVWIMARTVRANPTPGTILVCTGTYADCQGVITPSSGPPINTRFLSFEKLFF